MRARWLGKENILHPKSKGWGKIQCRRPGRMIDRPRTVLGRRLRPEVHLPPTFLPVCFAAVVGGIVCCSAVPKSCADCGELGRDDWMTASWNGRSACIVGESRGRSSTWLQAGGSEREMAATSCFGGSWRWNVRAAAAERGKLR